MYTVIYDGTCNLCVTLVRFLEQLDQGKTFQYVPMQDEDTLQRWQITPEDCEQGMILIEQANPQRRWQGSDAAEEIGRILPMGNLFVQAYRSLPGAKSTGDGFYAFIRDNRYKIFGGRDSLYEPEYPVCESDRCAKI
ncbi:DCC1-like thiol-disulfide oxidoreductase family protein [Oscillatoria sp. CS-180]|uniref:thiol-disulfide oxidoreductase DCC family protein n=1 Tax=Oscillatoria sp. CS-180 TaxID=3021720 RepID=UPI00232D2A29|nr:DCC1-like thiol-disulfide oxidoreductase family protein [Oscillatoria sp. CS-180]MDB9529156.1 DCC1-like thiol-disulfide oxidoreductase family protein [Oscillatoria sp. CS-180]